MTQFKWWFVSTSAFVCDALHIQFSSIPYVLAVYLSLSVRRLGSDESEAHVSGGPSEAEKGYVSKLAFVNALYILLVQFIQVLNIHHGPLVHCTIG